MLSKCPPTKRKNLVVRWTSPGFEIRETPQICNLHGEDCVSNQRVRRTEPKTIYINADALPGGRPESVAELAQRVEEYLHVNLIGQLSAVDEFALIQDPPAKVTVTDPRGRQTGAVPRGFARAAIPGSLYAAPGSNEVVVLMRPQGGVYRVKLSGSPSSRFALAMSFVDVASDGRPIVRRERRLAGQLGRTGITTARFDVDATAPRVKIAVPRQRLRGALRKGVRATLRCSERCTVGADLRLSPSMMRRIGVTSINRPIATGATRRRSRTQRLVVRFTPRAAARLERLRSLTLTVRVVVGDASGNARAARRIVHLLR